MKKYIDNIKISLAVLGLVFLFSFSNKRNNNRILAENCAVEFLNDDAHFITRSTVNKLLIQNRDSTSGVTKDQLVLSKVEESLNAHSMVQHADVYVSINGEVGAKVRQRTPIARVIGEQEYYIDSYGEKMPLSPVYSARVPLITGNNVDKAWSSLYELTKFIYKDEFLKKTITGIHVEDQHFELELREEDFTLFISRVNKLDLKFSNFKAFYQKGRNDKTLGNYKMVNLSFDNQVVCTKK